MIGIRWGVVGSQPAAGGLDFTITTPTAKIGAGTPSRAITLTLTGAGTLGSDASFALDDASAGGVFFPASPAVIASGQTVGATIQFVYTPPVGATGTKVLTATCTGGLTATHSLSLPIGTATVFLKDLLAGTAATALDSHSPDIGGTWVRQSTGGSGVYRLSGSGGIYDDATASTVGVYVNTAAADTTEFDALVDWIVLDNTLLCAPQLVCNGSSSESDVNGYVLQAYNNPIGQGWYSIMYVANIPTVLWGPVNSPAVTPGTYTGQKSLRSINGNQYVFDYAGGVLLHAPVMDNTFAGSKLVGVQTNTVSTGPQTAMTGTLLSALYGRNVDWA